MPDKEFKLTRKGSNNLKKGGVVSYIRITFIAILIFICFLPNPSLAQPYLIPLNHNFGNGLQDYVIKGKLETATLFKPLINPGLKGNISDSLIYIPYKSPKRKIIQRFFYNDLLELQKENYHIAVNPLFLLEMAHDTFPNKGNRYIINTRGIEVNGSVGKKFAFYSSFYENQATYPNYIDSIIRKTLVVPGQGARKDFQENGHDFSMSSGYLSFTPCNFLNVQLGHGKHFIGEGYRSLLLSDNAFNYPYLQFLLKHKKFRYYILYTEFQHFKDQYYFYHRKKHNTFLFLSWLPTANFEVGVFESITWKTTGENYSKRFNAAFYIPVLFVRPAFLGLNNSHNALYGLTAKWNVWKNLQLYNQIAVDNLTSKNIFKKEGPLENQYGFQLGAKLFDLIPNNTKHKTFLQVEYNYARPFTYSHTNELQNYAHFNQALAHPLGSGFKELVLIGKYRFQRLSVHFKYTHAVCSTDSLGSNFGSNIFLSNQGPTALNSSQDGYFVGFGQETSITHKYVSIGYLVNPVTNLQLIAGANIRSEKNQNLSRDDPYYFIGLRTGLRNLYFDF